MRDESAMSLANKWMRKNIPSCSNSALEGSRILTVAAVIAIMTEAKPYFLVGEGCDKNGLRGKLLKNCLRRGHHNHYFRGDSHKGKIIQILQFLIQFLIDG
jgi:hypothetical protein